MNKWICMLGLMAVLGGIFSTVQGALDVKDVDSVAEYALTQFVKEKKASFVEKDEDKLDAVGSSFTAKRIEPIEVTTLFLEELEKERSSRLEKAKKIDWTFPGVKENTLKDDKKSSIDRGDESSQKEQEKKEKNDEKSEVLEDSKVPVYPMDMLWTENPKVFLHEDVHVNSTRAEVLYAWGAPAAMWRNNTDKSTIFLYPAFQVSDKSIGNLEENERKKEEFSELLKKSYSSDSLAGTQSSVAYVWLSLAKGKVSHMGLIMSHEWPRFAIPAATLTKFEPNQMREEDFSLMAYHLRQTFTNDPNRSWEEKGKMFGHDFLGYGDVAVAYNDAKEVTRVMINSSMGMTRRGISLGDSKYLLLYLYGVPDFEEPASNHGNTNEVVFGYTHPVLPSTYLMFVVRDNFVSQIILANEKMSALYK